MLATALLRMQTLGSTRSGIAGKLGTQGGYEDRDVYTELGYPKTPKFGNHWLPAYRRNPLARAVITRPVDASWRLVPTLTESEDDETEFELKWIELVDRLGLWAKFKRLDRLATLGKYALLLIGFDDGLDLSQPVGMPQTILYVQPYSEGTATIDTWENDSTSERYGLPTRYKINTGSGQNNSQRLVHWSRVIHVVQDNDESEVEGNPALEPIYNDLTNIEKVLGAGAEGYWRNGFPWFLFSGQDDAELTSTEESTMEEKLYDFVHSIDRHLWGENIDVKQFAASLVDPSGIIDSTLKMISAGSQIPLRILLGSMTGQLASDEDKVIWAHYIEARRQDYCEPQIVRPFIERCLQHEIIPEAEKGYTLDWPDLLATGDKERAEVAEIRSRAIAQYANSLAAQDMLPPDAFFLHVLNMTRDEIAQIKEMVEQVRQEADSDIEPEDPDAV